MFESNDLLHHAIHFARFYARIPSEEYILSVGTSRYGMFPTKYCILNSRSIPPLAIFNHSVKEYATCFHIISQCGALVDHAKILALVEIMK